MKFQLRQEADFVYMFVVDGNKIGFSVITETDFYTSTYVRLDTDFEEDALYEKLRYYQYNDGFIPTKMIDGKNTIYVSELIAHPKSGFRNSEIIKMTLVQDIHKLCRFLKSILYELKAKCLTLYEDIQKLKDDLTKHPLPAYLHNPFVKFGTDFRYRLLKGEYIGYIDIFKYIEKLYKEKLEYGLTYNLVYKCNLCHHFNKVYKCSYCINRIKDPDDEMADG